MEATINIEKPVIQVVIEESPAIEVEITQPCASIDIIEAPAVAVEIVQPSLTVNLGCACSDGASEPSGPSTFEVTAGEDLAPRDLIYIAADGKAYKADANGSNKDSVAIIQVSILTDDTGDAYPPGSVITGFSGLTPGQRFFLSDSTPGAMMTVTPTDDGTEKVVQQVAKAISATAVLFDPKTVILIPPD